MALLSRIASSVIIALVRAYQVTLSPLFSGCCRFEPSCSNYMLEAVRTHGAAKGFLIGLWRLCRCHPFGGHGYEPVPAKGKWKWTPDEAQGGRTS